VIDRICSRDGALWRAPLTILERRRHLGAEDHDTVERGDQGPPNSPAPRPLLTAPVLCAGYHSALGKLRPLLEVLQVRDGRLLGRPCPHHTMRAVRSDGLNMISAAAGDNLVGLHDTIIWPFSRHSRMQPSRSPRAGTRQVAPKVRGWDGSCWVKRRRPAWRLLEAEDERRPATTWQHHHLLPVCRGIGNAGYSSSVRNAFP
jgi:hypothetical protein